MQLAGTIICSLVIVRLVLLISTTLQQSAARRKRNQLALELMSEQVRAATVLRKEREQLRLCWNGIRKFDVQRKICETEDVCSFYLTPHDRKPLPGFKPGQFLTFRMKLPEMEKAVTRCYSISSGPNSEYYRISVKRVPAPRGSEGIPPGLISNYLLDHVKENDILDVEAPRGGFCIDPTRDRPLVMIAGGVGVTPFASMLRAITESDSQREAILFYGVQNKEQCALGEELSGLANRQDNITVHHCFSRLKETDSKLPAGQFRERVSVDLLKRVLKANNYDFYLCGPAVMMQSMIADLKEWGVPEKRIFTEAFGPASGKALSHVKKASQKEGQKKTDETKTAASSESKSFQIRFEKSGKSKKWDSSLGNLLEFARANDVHIESGCETGYCGTCVVAIKSGHTVCLKEQVAETEEGTCLTCISIPDDDLVLDT